MNRPCSLVNVEGKVLEKESIPFSIRTRPKAGKLRNLLPGAHFYAGARAWGS